MRSQIKTLYYVLVVFQNESWFIQKHPGLQLELLNQIQFEMGAWHDIVVLKEIIHSVGLSSKKRIKPWKLFAVEDSLHKMMLSRARTINHELLPRSGLMKT